MKNVKPNNSRNILLIIALLSILTACQSGGRYALKNDSAPHDRYDDIDFSDAIPEHEPYREINSRPYTVLGKYYTPLFSGKGYEETGRASWYGQKFHGHLTSNGEVYDMFSMTAAHKTLPLPSFVKVTNLGNNKQVVVRVNDRGPFHESRVIDLSYAAAKKLDVIDHGVARVKLEVIHIDENGLMTIGKGKTFDPRNNISDQAIQTEPTVIVSSTPAKTKTEPGIFVQVAAISSKGKVDELRIGLGNLYQVKTKAPFIDNVYRLRLGPLENEQKAQILIEQLKDIGFKHAFPVIMSAD